LIMFNHRVFFSKKNVIVLSLKNKEVGVFFSVENNEKLLERK
jgi:hypothetical protein